MGGWAGGAVHHAGEVLTPTHVAGPPTYTHTIVLPAGASLARHLFAALHSAHPPLLEHAMILAGIDLSNPQASIDALIEKYVASKYAAGEADPEMKAAINAAIVADVQLAKELLKKYAVGSKVATTIEADAGSVLDKLVAKHPNLSTIVAQLKQNIPAA